MPAIKYLAHLFRFLIFLLFASSALKAQGPALRLQAVHHLTDTSGATTAAQVQQLYNQGKLLPTTTDPNFGRSHFRHWLVVAVTSTAATPAVLVVQNPFLYYVALYQQQATGPVLLSQTGIQYPFNQRPVHHRFFSFPVHLQKGTNLLYLHADRRGELLRFSLQLKKPEAFQWEAAADASFFGGVFGVLLLLFAFSISLVVVLKESLHLYYALYVLCMLLFVAADNGYGYQWLWPQAPLVQKYIRSFTGFPAFVVHLWFLWSL